MSMFGWSLLLGLVVVRGEDPSVANGELTPPDLPFPPMPSKAVIGPTLADSVNSWPPKRKPLKKDVPNILIILNDDVGFGAPDTFGGPVHTPTLSKVAAHGVAYNRFPVLFYFCWCFHYAFGLNRPWRLANSWGFHTTAICSPTRASLLTGRNSHHVGAGQITEAAAGFPGEPRLGGFPILETIWPAAIGVWPSKL